MLHRAVKTQGGAKLPTVTAMPAAAAAGKPHVNGSDQRATRLWRRLERLDADSDRVRAQLRTVAPPVLECAEGMSDVQLVELLERADVQSDVLRKALATRVSRSEACRTPTTSCSASCGS